MEPAYYTELAQKVYIILSVIIVYALAIIAGYECAVDFDIDRETGEKLPKFSLGSALFGGAVVGLVVGACAAVGFVLLFLIGLAMVPVYLLLLAGGIGYGVRRYRGLDN